LEDVLSGHPKIRDIAIVGMPDAVLGQRVVAFIVAQSDEAVSLKDLTDYLAELGVAKFKWPEHLEILTEMPLGPGGKVKKDTLRQWALERAASAPPS
jgi:non-ribosomal peptide synthetase component E (peptide arylation enzyme)